MQGHWTLSNAFPKNSRYRTELLSIMAVRTDVCAFTLSIASGRMKESCPFMDKSFNAFCFNDSFNLSLLTSTSSFSTSKKVLTTILSGKV